MIFLRRLTGSLALLLCGSAAAVEINFTSPAFEIGRSSDGSVLTNGFTFSLGSFGAFTPTVSNESQWLGNFTSLGSVAWDTTFTQYSQTVSLSSNAAPFSVGTQGYVWGYNSQTYAAGSEWLLLTNASWTFPASSTFGAVGWDASDAGTTAIVGLLAASMGSDPYLKTAMVSAPLVINGITVANLNGTAGGAITQNGTLTISGAANLKTLSDAGASITLDVDANTFGSITARVRNAADTADTSATINIHSTGPMTLAGISTGGGVTLVSNGGAITQTAPIIAGGATSITAGAAAITLTNAGNDFTGPLSLSNVGANAASITDANALLLGTVSVGGTVNLTAPSGITTSGNLTAGAVAFNNAATLGGNVTTVGSQTYSDTVTLQAATTVSSTSNGAISFLSSINGNNNSLTVDTGGSTAFVSASGLTSLTKNGAGTMTLTGQSTYTGGTVVNGGTLALGVTNSLFFSSPLTLGGGTVALNGHSQALGLLAISANSVLSFGAGASLSFANSSALTWGGTLTITNYTTASDSLRFGTSAAGLTQAELSLFRFADYGNVPGQIDSLGYVTPSAIPEPTTWAALAGLAALGAAGIVRRRGRGAR